MARVLVMGGDGTVGRALAAALRQRGDTVFATTRSAVRVAAERPFLDLAQPDGTELPDATLAILCAAFTGYAACRGNPQHAHAVNVAGPAALGRRLTQLGCRLIHLSSGAVFDGSRPDMPADAPLSPVSIYGETKAAAETALGGSATIIRPAKVLPPDFALLAGWCAALARGDAIDAFEDMWLAPISLTHLVHAILAIADSGETGIFQVSARRDISYLELARRLAHALGAPPGLVRAVRAADRGIPAEERPRWTSLDASRLAALTGREPPDPFEAVDAVLAAQRAKVAA